MKRTDVPRSGPALGGIGAGSIELRKDGIFRNWTIFNNMPLFGGPRLEVQDDESLFFMVRWQEPGEHPQLRLLQIMSDKPHPAGIQLQFYTFRWVQSVAEVEMTTRWPISTLKFTDPDMPFEIEMDAFTPFIPHNVKDSALPGAYFHFTLTPKKKRPCEVLLIATLKNMVGYANPKHSYAGGQASGEKWQGFRFSAEHIADNDPSNGQMVLAAEGSEGISHHLGWSHRHIFHEPLLHNNQLQNIDQIAEQNKDDEEAGHKVATHPCFGSIAKRLELSGKKKEAVSQAFALSWFFPNAYADATKKQKQTGKEEPTRLEGHYYANHFKNAQEVADYLVNERPRLDGETRGFINAFYDSTLPEPVLNVVNAQLNTFVTSAWLNKDGDFGVQEGLTEEANWGPLATVDVGMYGSIAAAALFPDLDRAIWEKHRELMDDKGEVAHGIGRNFAKTDGSHEGVKSRVDLNPQYVVQSVRHYFFNDDIQWLRNMWPSIRKAADYTLNQRDKDNDGLPEMAGSNSSYDNFPMFGPASYIASQWLSALAHAKAAAEDLGEADDAKRYGEAFEKARARFEEKLWNGKYFSLFNDEGGDHGGHDEGCLSDQIIGQWANHLAGLGDIADRKKLDAALDYVVKRNLIPGEGLYNCRWPEDDWLHPVADSCWFDQSNTFWTGVELAFASFLAYENRTKDALALIEAVEKRYREDNRTWDHQEWGGHYFRPMSAWAIMHGFLGLAWKGEVAAFAPRIKGKSLRLVFTHPHGYGRYERESAKSKDTVTIHSLRGEFTLKNLLLGLKTKAPEKVSVTQGGQELEIKEQEIRKDAPENLALTFVKPVKISPETPLTIEALA